MPALQIQTFGMLRHLLCHAASMYCDDCVTPVVEPYFYRPKSHTLVKLVLWMEMNYQYTNRIQNTSLEAREPKEDSIKAVQVGSLTLMLMAQSI